MCDGCKNGGKPMAALFIRVSTPVQKELSPETQLEAKPWLEEQGYQVPERYILNFVWAIQ